MSDDKYSDKARSIAAFGQKRRLVPLEEQARELFTELVRERGEDGARKLWRAVAAKTRGRKRGATPKTLQLRSAAEEEFGGKLTTYEIENGTAKEAIRKAAAKGLGDSKRDTRGHYPEIETNTKSIVAAIHAQTVDVLSDEIGAALDAADALDQREKK